MTNISKHGDSSISLGQNFEVDKLLKARYIIKNNKRESSIIEFHIEKIAEAKPGSKEKKNKRTIKNPAPETSPKI